LTPKNPYCEQSGLVVGLLVSLLVGYVASWGIASSDNADVDVDAQRLKVVCEHAHTPSLHAIVLANAHTSALYVCIPNNAPQALLCADESCLVRGAITHKHLAELVPDEYLQLRAGGCT
jgi:hypothetical protein